MTKRINISIDENLYERLQGFKAQINVSKVCQDAISKEVLKKEDFKKRMDETEDLNAIAERLKKQAMSKESMDTVYERAKLDGEVWAKVADYDDLMVMIETAERDDIVDGDNPDDLEPEILVYLIEKNGIDIGKPVGQAEFSDYLKAVLPDIKLHFFNTAELELAYRRGWYKGVMDLWIEIAARLPTYSQTDKKFDPSKELDEKTLIEAMKKKGLSDEDIEKYIAGMKGKAGQEKKAADK